MVRAYHSLWLRTARRQTTELGVLLRRPGSHTIRARVTPEGRGVDGSESVTSERDHAGGVDTGSRQAAAHSIPGARPRAGHAGCPDHIEPREDLIASTVESALR
jgi:hypothetical protein